MTSSKEGQAVRSHVFPEHALLETRADADGLPAKVYWVSAEGGQIIVSLHVSGIDEQRLEVAAGIFALSPSQ